MFDNKQIDILNALYIIKGVCVSNEKCEYCPLCKGNTCVLLQYSPDKWNINTANDVWRAFR